MTTVTLQSIADALGVSRTTVSNAYNRPDQLTPELRSRILDTAAALGYRGPNAAARTLRTGRRNAVGLLFTEDLRYVFSDPDTSAFLRGVAETTADAGLGLLLLPVPTGTDPHESAVRSASVDGFLVYSVPNAHPSLDLLPWGDQPVVVVDEPDDRDGVGFLGIDDTAGAELATRHLLDLGHRRIAVVAGRLGVDPTPGRVDAERRAAATVRVARRRLEGALAALATAGIAADDVPIWEAAGNDPDSGRRAATELFEAYPDVTGIVCFTDQVAIGAIQAAQSLGRVVPRDLSVVGFDDIPRATTWQPSLTTIRQPLVDKGRQAARMLLEAIDGRPPSRTMLPIELVDRESSAPPVSI